VVSNRLRQHGQQSHDKFRAKWKKQQDDLKMSSEAERWASGAANGRSEAEAIGGRLQADVKRVQEWSEGRVICPSDLIPSLA
jgi:hypothetical protein